MFQRGLRGVIRRQRTQRGLLCQFLPKSGSPPGLKELSQLFIFKADPVYIYIVNKSPRTHLGVKWGIGLWSLPQSKGSDLYLESTIHVTWRFSISWLSSNLYLYGSAISHTFVFLHASPHGENMFSMWVSVWCRTAFYLSLILNCPRTWLLSTKYLGVAMILLWPQFSWQGILQTAKVSKVIMVLFLISEISLCITWLGINILFTPI